MTTNRKDRDAMAARGCWERLQLVKGTITAVIDGANPGTLVRTAHKDWYRELFQPPRR